MSSSGKPVLSLVFEVGIPFLLRAITPLHPGSGARVSGYVDLPVQREAHTDLPVIYGSSLKGALRSWAIARKGLQKTDVEELFGPEPGAGDKEMGQAVFTDAKLLMIPVRSLKGIFGWITCPLILKRFKEDMKTVSGLAGTKIEVPDPPEVGDEEAVGTPKNGLRLRPKGNEVVILEDMVLNFRSGEIGPLKPLLNNRTERLGLEERVLVVSDDTFKRLLKRAMEVTPHIAINDETGTVSNLWFQENLPAETIMYSVAFTKKDLKSKLEKVLEDIVHVGGDITTGLGFAEVIRVG